MMLILISVFKMMLVLTSFKIIDFNYLFHLLINEAKLILDFFINYHL